MEPVVKTAENQDRCKISLREQADHAHGELAFRHRMYPARVKAGTMKKIDATRGLEMMRAIRDTLRLFAEHEDLIRLTLRQALEAKRHENHPAVQAVRTAFPDAAVTAVRPQYDFTEDSAA